MHAICTRKDLTSHDKSKIKNDRLENSLNAVTVNKGMPESSLTSPARLEMIIFRQGICRLWMRQIIYSRGGTLFVYVAEVFLWASRIRSATRGCATIWVRHGLATGQAILESVFLDLSSSICHSIMSQSVTRDELRLFFVYNDYVGKLTSPSSTNP